MKRKYHGKLYINQRIQIPTHYDSWMRGARFGKITAFRQGAPGRSDCLLVKMDHPQVKRRLKLWRLDWDYAQPVNRPRKLTSGEVPFLASQWGSYIRSGDPGAVFYAFGDDGRPVNAEHAKACIAWVDNHCREAANMNDDPESDHDDLDALRAWFADCLADGNFRAA